MSRRLVPCFCSREQTGTKLVSGRAWEGVWRGEEGDQNAILTCTPVFTAALCTLVKIWQQPKRPLTDEWIKKIRYLNGYNAVLVSHKKMNELIPFAATWVGLEIIILREVTQRKANIIRCHLYAVFKKMARVKLSTKQKQTPTENKLMDTKAIN